MIPSGTRSFETPLGYATDFCSVCQRIQTVRVREIRIGAHIGMIQVGDEAAHFHSAECLTCGWETEIHQDPPRKYLESPPLNGECPSSRNSQTVSDSPFHPVAEPLSPGQRSAKLDEAFLETDWFLEVRLMRGIVLDRRMLLTCAFWIVLMVVLSGVCIYLASEADEAGNTSLGQLYGATSCLVIVGAVSMICLPLVRYPRHLVKHLAIPLLARRLSPLKPTVAELEDRIRARAEGGRRCNLWSNVSANQMEALSSEFDTQSRNAGQARH